MLGRFSPSPTIRHLGFQYTTWHLNGYRNNEQVTKRRRYSSTRNNYLPSTARYLATHVLSVACLETATSWVSGRNSGPVLQTRVRAKERAPGLALGVADMDFACAMLRPHRALLADTWS